MGKQKILTAVLITAITITAMTANFSTALAASTSTTNFKEVVLEHSRVP